MMHTLHCLENDDTLHTMYQPYFILYSLEASGFVNFDYIERYLLYLLGDHCGAN
jgi:hypothetical protein